MKARQNPSQPGPGKKDKDPSEKQNDGTSNPKKPGNDPDQTPDREITNPPQAEPGNENGPGENKDSPAYN